MFLQVTIKNTDGGYTESAVNTNIIRCINNCRNPEDGAMLYYIDRPDTEGVPIKERKEDLFLHTLG